MGCGMWDAETRLAYRTYVRYGGGIMTPTPVEDLDAAGTLAAASATLRWRRAAEVEDLRLAQHWADLHAEDPAAARRAAGLPVRPFEDRLVAVGGPGCPEVAESALAEL